MVAWPPELREFLEAVLADSPRLSGGLCIGFSEVFDPPVTGGFTDDEKERVAFARSACGRCPVLEACRQWVDGLPLKRRPTGVVAGVVRRSYRRGEASSYTHGPGAR
jgi:hypothetical protein